MKKNKSDEDICFFNLTLLNTFKRFWTFKKFPEKSEKLKKLKNYLN